MRERERETKEIREETKERPKIRGSEKRIEIRERIEMRDAAGCLVSQLP